MSTIRLCKNCTFFRKLGERCLHERSKATAVDFIHGEHSVSFAPAQWARSPNGACHESGLLYEEAVQPADNVVPFRRG